MFRYDPVSSPCTRRICLLHHIGRSESVTSQRAQVVDDSLGESKATQSCLLHERLRNLRAQDRQFFKQKSHRHRQNKCGRERNKTRHRISRYVQID